MILICGLGSVGRRHLRNLRALGYEDVVLYRTGRSTLPDDDHLSDLPVAYDLAEALDANPEAVIVANPTALHMPVALQAVRAGCNVFLEKPISHTMEGVEDLRHEVERQGRQVLVGFQFRFHPGLRQVKQWIDDGAIGAVVSARVQWGEYLPDWHPWEDYRQGYSARADLGGGVLLTLCHPFDYLRWLIGEVTAVSAMTGRLSGLVLDVEDTAQVTMRFASGAIGHVYLDYAERPPTHGLRLVGQQGSITWDAATGLARLYRAATDAWTIAELPPGFERNTLFVEEMRHFLACLDRQTHPLCTLQDGIRTLEIVLAAKESNAQRRTIDLSTSI